MYKRKYKKGNKINNISQLSDYNDYLYIRDKMWHAGWWQSLQFIYLKRVIEQGVVYFANKN